MHHNPIVTRDEWLVARKQRLATEKELTRLRDQLSAERRELPWVRVEKQYVFDGPNGKETLADLFDGRSQLIVKHFMLGPGWKEGCVGCSFEVDHIEDALVHLEHHDVTYVAVARAPYPRPKRSRSAWAGTSSGCRRTAATSTTTFMCRSQRVKSPRAVLDNPKERHKL